MLNLEKTTAYTNKDWAQGYQSQKNEYEYWIENITGEIPLNLAGTLFRNIPAMLDINGVSVRHPFDGDGMICSIGFQDGKAFFRNRYSISLEFFVSNPFSFKRLKWEKFISHEKWFISKFFDANIAWA